MNFRPFKLVLCSVIKLDPGSMNQSTCYGNFEYYEMLCQMIKQGHFLKFSMIDIKTQGCVSINAKNAFDFF